MVGISLGIILLIVSLYMIVPFDWGLGWTEAFLFVLQGILPLFLISLALFFIIISIADMYDAKVAKEQEEKLKARLKEKNKTTE